jgi:biopolymer transport protein ExbB
MGKPRCPRIVQTAGGRVFRAAFGLLLLGSLGMWGPWPAGVTRAFGQEGRSSRVPTPAGSIGAGSIAIDGSDDATGGDASSPGRSGTSESFLTAIGNASAPVVIVTIVIVLMSFYLTALVVWMAIYYRTQVAVPSELVRYVQDLLDQTRYNEAYQRIAIDASFLARVLASGVRKLPAGMAQAQRAMELANEDVTMEMEHRTTYLATVGTLGPMIGLVGTVYGMIISFRVLAIEGTTPQAGQLAAGISTALYSTFEGIAISIPAIFFYALFRNRIARLSLEVGLAAEPLLDQFAPGVRSAGVGARYTQSAAPQGATAPSTPGVHPHPFAVSAAMAAAGVNPPRASLPPAEPAQGAVVSSQ